MHASVSDVPGGQGDMWSDNHCGNEILSGAGYGAGK